MTNLDKILKVYDLLKANLCYECQDECEVCAVRLIREYICKFEKEERMWENK